MITEQELKNIIYDDDFEHYDVVIHGVMFRVRSAIGVFEETYNVLVVLDDKEAIVSVGNLEETYSYLAISEMVNGDYYGV